MLSFYGAVRFGLALAGLGSAVVSSVSATDTHTFPTTGSWMTVDNSVVTINYSTGPESLYFSGTGATNTNALVGIIVDATVNDYPSSQTDQATLNGLFEFVHTSLSTATPPITNPKCCWPFNFALGIGCTPDTVNQFVIPPSVPAKTLTATAKAAEPTTAMQPNQPYQLYCGGWKSTTAVVQGKSSTTITYNSLWVSLETVKSTSPPIQGDLNWVVDGSPAFPAVVGFNGKVIKPAVPASTFAVAPVLTYLQVNSALINSGTATNPDGTTGWLQAIDANGNNPDGSDNGASVDQSTGFINWSATVAPSSDTADSKTVVDVIGCSYQDPNTGTYSTVNDKTHWPVPAAGPGGKVVRADYNPTCYLKAVTEGKVETETISVTLDIAVLSACQPTSGQTYTFNDLESTYANYYKTKPTVNSDIHVGYNDGVTNTPANGVYTLKVVTPKSPAAVEFPWYSFLTSATEKEGLNGINTDPIGYYYSIKNQGTVPAFVSGSAGVQNGHQGVVPTGVVPANRVNDQYQPFVCMAVDQNKLVAGAFPSGAAYQLVNDQTKWPIGHTYVIKCDIWDLSGNRNQISLVLPIAGYTCVKHSGVCGDPQFAGFLGQSYQVHGVSGQVYNVLSTPSFQYNALFTYLSTGSCRTGTQCFSHPGNYFGAVGMLIKSADGSVNVVRVVAGPVDTGLTVYVNDAVMPVSSQAVQIGDATFYLTTPFDLTMDGNEFSLKLSNSDMFLNQDVSINTPLLRQIQHFKQATKSANSTAAAEIRASLPHGLLGQTWEYKTYDNRWKYVEGSLFEYSVADGITGTDFKYNRF